MAGIGLDSRIGAKFLNPGAGWGGANISDPLDILVSGGRIATLAGDAPDDLGIVEAVAFLLENPGANGLTLKIDGGLHCM